MERGLLPDRTDATDPVLVDRLVVVPDGGLVWGLLADALPGSVAGCAGGSGDGVVATDAA